MEGIIDYLRRPILRIETPSADGFLCHIDTGFNRRLLFEHSVARRFGFELRGDGLQDQIVLGDGRMTFAWLARGTIIWFGHPLVVEAHVIPDARRRRYISPESEIDALIGTALLDGLRVVLDFRRRLVTISETGDE